MSKVWVISFQDGSDNTWAVVDELPIVFQVEEEELDDPNYSPQFPCGVILDHVHIQDMVAHFELCAPISD